MSTKESTRFRQAERVLSIMLICAAVCFVLFLLSAGLGITWLKIFTAVVTIVPSALALAWLCMTGEVKHWRLRSRYLILGFSALVLCTLLSLLLNYPSPTAVG